MSPSPERGAAQFFRLDEVAPGPVGEPALLEGCSGRLLSEDPATGQRTLLVEIPTGWSAPAGGGEGTLELLILEGDLAVGDDRLGAGGFIAAPTGCERPPLECIGPARAVVVWSPHFGPGEYYGSAPHVVRTWEQPWEATEFPAGLEAPGRLHGVWYKSLRWPDPIGDHVHGGPQGLLRLVFMAAGFVGDHRQESHPGCWEEIVWLAGDFFMPGTGRQAVGSYVGNPPSHLHGPLLTQRGCILLVHTDAPADFCFHEPPVPDELIDSYMDGVSWLDDPVHVPSPARSAQWSGAVPVAGVLESGSTG